MFKEKEINFENEKKFERVEKKYKNLIISYEVAKESFYRYGIISDEIDIARVYEIKNLQIKDKNSGEVFDPSSLLPEEYQIAIVENATSRVIGHKKIVSISGLGDFGNQFTLLHEIAHAREQRDLEPYEAIEIGGEELEILTVISAEEFREEIPYEEQADKFALSKIIELRKEGINLEPEMNDEELLKHIQRREEIMQNILSRS